MRSGAVSASVPSRSKTMVGARSVMTWPNLARGRAQGRRRRARSVGQLASAPEFARALHLVDQACPFPKTTSRFRGTCPKRTRDDPRAEAGRSFTGVIELRLDAAS